VEPSELHSALSSILRQENKVDKIVVVPAVHQGVLMNLKQFASMDLDMLESSLFQKVWVRIDDAMKPMHARMAYELYNIMHLRECER
jgi:hypothetical protein